MYSTYNLWNSPLLIETSLLGACNSTNTQFMILPLSRLSRAGPARLLQTAVPGSSLRPLPTAVNFSHALVLRSCAKLGSPERCPEFDYVRSVQ